MDKIELNREQKLEKKEIFENMKKEIKKTEFKVKHPKMIKNLKIFKSVTKLISPYVLTAGITFGIFSLTGNCPFVRNDRKNFLNTKTIKDSKGSIRIEEKYDEYEDTDSILKTYSKWEYDGNNYCREVNTYSLDGMDSKMTEEMLDSNITSLEDILGNPLNSYIEKCNNIDNNIDNTNYIEIIKYDVKENDFIYVKDDVRETIGMSAVYIFILSIINFPVAAIYPYNISKLKEEIESYNADTEQEKKKLEIKKNNYKRLVR